MCARARVYVTNWLWLSTLVHKTVLRYPIWYVVTGTRIGTIGWHSDATEVVQPRYQRVQKRIRQWTDMVLCSMYNTRM